MSFNKGLVGDNQIIKKTLAIDTGVLMSELEVLVRIRCSRVS